MEANPGETGVPGPKNPPRYLVVLFFILAATGVAAFLTGITAPQPIRAWQAYLVNFVFWTGLSFGAVLFVAILNMTNARWGRPLKRLAEGLGSFLPLSFVLFWVLYPGREEIFPWVREPVHGKEAWLNAGFLFLRDGAGLLLLALVSSALIYFSLRMDRGVGSWNSSRSGPLSRNLNAQVQKEWRAQTVLSPIFAVFYALVLSLIAFDLIMSLDPHWYSTLFGAYYFISSFYTALAALVFLSVLVKGPLGLEKFIQPRHFHDLGKLLLGFCLMTGDFFYSQFLVIWYGNLPEETKYVILRVRQGPWEPLAWTVLVLSFALPFVVLLSRKIKLKPYAMMCLCAVVLVGMLLERFLLVVPSTWKTEVFPMGLLEVLITAGFVGLFGLTLTWFFRRFPPLPLSDPLFRETLGEMEILPNDGRKHD